MTVRFLSKPSVGHICGQGFVSKITYQFRSFVSLAFTAFFETGRKGSRDYFISKLY